MSLYKILWAILIVMANCVLAREITPVKPMQDSENCYLISNAEELYGFAAIVNGTDGFDKDSTACGKLTDDVVVNKNVINKNYQDTIKFTDYLNVSDTASFVVWSILEVYSGIFDGQGHTISGLYFNDTTVNYVGFIGLYNAGGYYSEGGTRIKNLGLVDSYFVGKYCIGGFIAESFGKIKMERCFFDGFAGYTHYLGHYMDYVFVGGLVGMAFLGIEISECYTKGVTFGTVLYLTNSYTVASGFVGGLLGSVVLNKSKITNSYSLVRSYGCFVSDLVGTVSTKYWLNTWDNSQKSMYMYMKKTELEYYNSYNFGKIIADKTCTNYNGVLLSEYDGYDTLSAKSYNSFFKGDASSPVNEKNAEKYALPWSINKKIYVPTLQSIEIYDDNFDLIPLTNTASYINEKTAVRDGTLAKNLRRFVELDSNKNVVENGSNGLVWGQDFVNDSFPSLIGKFIYPLKLNLNGGKLDSVPNSYVMGEGRVLPVPKRNKYVFEGWYESETPSEDEEPVTEVSKDAEGSVEYYAKWSVAKYKVTVVVNNLLGGRVDGQNETGYYDVDSVLTLTAVPAVGFAFAGWEDNYDLLETRSLVVAGDTEIVVNFTKYKSKDILDEEFVEQSSSSSKKAKSSSSSKKAIDKKVGIMAQAVPPKFSVEVHGRNVRIYGARRESTFALFSVQGGVVEMGNVSNRGEISLAVKHAGCYIIRVGDEAVRVNVR